MSTQKLENNKKLNVQCVLFISFVVCASMTSVLQARAQENAEREKISIVENVLLKKYAKNAVTSPILPEMCFFWQVHGINSGDDAIHDNQCTDESFKTQRLHHCFQGWVPRAVAKGIATRSKNATRGSWPYY